MSVSYSLFLSIAGKAQPDNSNLFALELENERLQRQLLLLQEQNIQARHRRKDDREGRRRFPRPRALSLQREPFQPWLYHQPRRRAITNYTHLKPLDVNLNPLAPKARAPEHWSLERTDITAIDPFKEKIDSDLQNKFGYDLGGSRIGYTRHEMPEDLRAPSRDRSHEGIRTLIPDLDNKEGVTALNPEPAEGKAATAAPQKKPSNDGNGLPPLDLKTLSESEPESSSRQGKGGGKGQPAKQKPLSLNLGGRGPATDPNKTTPAKTAGPSKFNGNPKKSTQFEEEFFANTSRTDPEDINSFDRKNARHLLDPSTLSGYKPLSEMYGGRPNIGNAANAYSQPGNPTRPQPLSRPTVLVSGAPH